MLEVSRNEIAQKTTRIHPKGKRNLMCYGKCRYEDINGECRVRVKPDDAYCKQETEEEHQSDSREE
jgi:hypothetical protein